MSKIKITFTGQDFSIRFGVPIIVLTMDEEGNKEASLEFDDKVNETQIIGMPKRVHKAFTVSAVTKILSKDVIPVKKMPETVDFDDPNMLDGSPVLDGYDYQVTITMDEVMKSYEANDVSIETYTLLRYLASWFRSLYR